GEFGLQTHDIVTREDSDGIEPEHTVAQLVPGLFELRKRLSAEHTVTENASVLLELTDSEFEGPVEVRRFGVSDCESQPCHLRFDVGQHLRNVATRVARLGGVHQCGANLRSSESRWGYIGSDTSKAPVDPTTGALELDQMNSESSSSRAGFGRAPMMVLATSPSLKTYSAGIDVMP